MATVWRDVARSRWLDVVTDALARHDGFPWARVCEELGHQLRATLTGRFTWDRHGRTQITAYPFPSSYDLAAVAHLAPSAHPLARHYLASGSPEPLSTTQLPFVGDQAVRDYEDMLRSLEIEHHLWLPLEHTRDGVVVVGVARSAQRFDDHSLAKAALAHQVVVALHRHFLALDAWISRHPLGSEAVAAATHADLTPRQAVVLALAGEGLTAHAIARRLAISPRTVERHLQNVYVRLGVSDRVSAVRHGIAAGLIPPERPGAV